MRSRVNWGNKCQKSLKSLMNDTVGRCSGGQLHERWTGGAFRGGQLIVTTAVHQTVLPVCCSPGSKATSRRPDRTRTARRPEHMVQCDAHCRLNRAHSGPPIGQFTVHRAHRSSEIATVSSQLHQFKNPALPVQSLTSQSCQSQS